MVAVSSGHKVLGSSAGAVLAWLVAMVLSEIRGSLAQRIVRIAVPTSNSARVLKQAEGFELQI